MDPFPSELKWFTAALFGTAALAAALVAFLQPTFPVVPVLLLGSLVVLSAQRQVRLANGIRLSPGFMVAMAALVVCVAKGSLLGVVVVGALSNLRFEHCVRGRRGWLVFNTACAGLAFLVAGLAYSLWPSGAKDSLPVELIGVVPAVFAYLAVAWLVLLLSYVVEGSRPWRDVLTELVSAAFEMLPFAVLGFLLGRLYLSLGPGVLVLIIVPILIAREMFASYIRVKDAHEETVGMLIRALEAKDRYTSGHSERVATYAKYMGEQLNFMPGRLERLRFAALMHDIGKLVVPNHLLNKPGRLTADEFTQVRIHEKVSVQMLSHIDFLRPIAAAGHSDATTFDPDDTDHPIEPYIVMIADAYDAMTSTRAYRKALPQNVAFQELRDKAGVQFHPACVEALITAVEAKGEHHGAGYEIQDEFEDAPEAGLGSAGLGDLLPSDAP